MKYWKVPTAPSASTSVSSSRAMTLSRSRVACAWRSGSRIHPSPSAAGPADVSRALEVAEGGDDRFDDLRLVRVGDLLERLGVRHRQVGAGDAADRGVEMVEGLLLDQRGEVRADAAVRPALLDDHAAVGLAHRLEDRVEVERAQRARVDYLRLDLVLVGELLGRLLRG